MTQLRELHPSSSTLERETAKVKKRDGRHHTHICELPFYITAGNGGDKDKNEGLKLWYTQAVDGSVWMLTKLNPDMTARRRLGL